MKTLGAIPRENKGLTKLRRTKESNTEERTSMNNHAAVAEATYRLPATRHGRACCPCMAMLQGMIVRPSSLRSRAGFWTSRFSSFIWGGLFAGFLGEQN